MSLVVGSMAMFCLGLYGTLTRRDIIGILASIEVMMGGGLVLLVGLAATSLDPSRLEATALLLLVVAAAEAAVGLALLVAVARHRRETRIDHLKDVRG